MMALKQPRISSSLWQFCDELLGSVNASQYKGYVLTVLFMNYFSDRNYSRIQVAEGGSFADMAALNDEIKLGLGKEMQDKRLWGHS